MCCARWECLSNFKSDKETKEHQISGKNICIRAMFANSHCLLNAECWYYLSRNDGPALTGETISVRFVHKAVETRAQQCHSRSAQTNTNAPRITSKWAFYRMKFEISLESLKSLLSRSSLFWILLWFLYALYSLKPCPDSDENISANNAKAMWYVINGRQRLKSHKMCNYTVGYALALYS